MAKEKDHDPLIVPFDSKQGRAQPRSPSRNGDHPHKAPSAQPNTEVQPSPEMVRSALAGNLKNVTSAAYFYTTVASSLTDNMGTDVFQAYRDQLLHDAGNPSDPIEIMLIEQLALAHFNIGRLQIRSSSVQDAKLSVVFSDAATRLLGEFRRCTLALEDYRAKQAARKVPSASTEEREKKPSAKRNGKPRPSTNGQKKANGVELAANGDIPKCIKDRMNPSIPAVLPLASSTGRNGQG